MTAPAAGVRAYPRCDQKTAVQFIDSVLAKLPFAVERVQTDNGSEFGASFHWHLLDKGILQDGEPFLAGTAPRAAAKVSATTAASLGVVEGDSVTVTAGASTVTVPVTVTEMADHVVWLPTNSAGCDLRGTLADAPGIRVSVTKVDSE